MTFLHSVCYRGNSHNHTTSRHGRSPTRFVLPVSLSCPPCVMFLSPKCHLCAVFLSFLSHFHVFLSKTGDFSQSLSSGFTILSFLPNFLFTGFLVSFFCVNMSACVCKNERDEVISKRSQGFCLCPGWVLLLKGVSGAPGDLWQLWESPNTANTDRPAAQRLTSEYLGHYKPDITNHLDSCDFDRVS